MHLRIRICHSPDREMSSYNFAYEGQVGHLQQQKVKRVRYATGSYCSRVGAADCHPFPMAGDRHRVVDYEEAHSRTTRTK